MNFVVAAMLLLEGLDEASAFAVFAHALMQLHARLLFNGQSSCLTRYLSHFELMLRRDAPRRARQHGGGTPLPIRRTSVSARRRPP